MILIPAPTHTHTHLTPHPASYAALILLILFSDRLPLCVSCVLCLLCVRAIGSTVAVVSGCPMFSSGITSPRAAGSQSARFDKSNQVLRVKNGCTDGLETAISHYYIVITFIFLSLCAPVTLSDVLVYRTHYIYSVFPLFFHLLEA